MYVPLQHNRPICQLNISIILRRLESSSKRQTCIQQRKRLSLIPRMSLGLLLTQYIDEAGHLLARNALVTSHRFIERVVEH